MYCAPDMIQKGAGMATLKKMEAVFNDSMDMDSEWLDQGADDVEVETEDLETEG